MTKGQNQNRVSMGPSGPAAGVLPCLDAEAVFCYREVLNISRDRQELTLTLTLTLTLNLTLTLIGGTEYKPRSSRPTNY